MSSKLPKKLLSSKRAWKSFKATFQTKLAKLNISSTTLIKRSKKYCIHVLNFIRLLIPHEKLNALISSSRSSPPSRCHFQYHRQQNQYKPSFSAIYIEELFPVQNGSFAHDDPIKAKEMVASSSSNIMDGKQHDRIGSLGTLKINDDGEKKGEKREAETGEASNYCGGRNNAWKLPNLVPQFRGVDERAEEFISKFREEMRLEREKSIIDFQEMLARSS